MAIWFISLNIASMEKMTIKQYAVWRGISVQAAHKRIKSVKNYPEIRGVEKITDKFFMLKVNKDKALQEFATK